MIPAPPSSGRARRFGVRTLAWASLLAVVACGRREVIVYEPPVNASQLALRLEAQERIDAPTRVVFEWAVAEQGVRASGRGVTRMEPPYKARLDLFLGNGETAGRAALVDDALRLPARMPPSVLPPPHLLWATVGVFRPGLGTALLGADREDGRIRMRYGLPGGREAHYLIANGRLEEVEVLRDGTVVQRVTLERDGLGVPTEAVFRDLVEVRELRLTRESVQQTEPFPSDIWYP